MTLTDKLFSIDSITSDADLQYTADISLNPDHPIFRGHYPGLPLTPGVCQIDIVRTVLQEIKKTEVRLIDAKNIKFTNPIDPRRVLSLKLKLVLEGTADEIRVKSTLFSAETVFFQFSGRFTTFSLPARSVSESNSLLPNDSTALNK